MKRALHVYMFLMLNLEPPDMWQRVWVTPLHWASAVLVETKLLKLHVHQIFMIVLLLAAPRPKKDDVASGMMKALNLTVLTVLGCVVVGMTRGGDFRQAMFQIYPVLTGVLVAHTLVRVLSTPEDYVALGKVILWAGLYRAFMCVAFYVLVVRENVLPTIPETITTHDDTVLFVSILLGMLVYAFESQDPKQRRFTYFAVPLVLAAIQFNNRRLAWVSLSMAMVVVYFVLPRGESRAQVNKVLRKVAPYALTYLLAAKIAVDSGSQSPIFKPVASLLSSSDPNNPSTRSRLAENMGLIVTLSPELVLGTGFGHEYTDVDSTLAATNFLQYRYVPHNSLLGFVAFCGVMGFAGIWIVVPTCILLGARAYRLAELPETRTIAALCAAQGVIFASQAYGDMGLFSYVSVLLSACAWAAAARLAVHRPEFVEEQELELSPG